MSGPLVVPLAAACDYKRLATFDEGPNTGGMGAYTPVPWFGTRELETAAAEIFEPIAWRMARDGDPYRGVLYAGLMLTDDGPMVIEFNARFGDPEAQVILPMLDGSLAHALLGTATGDRGLMEGSLGVRSGAAVGVVIAAEGYPDAPVTGRRIEGAEPATPSDDGEVLAFHAGTGGLATAATSRPGGAWSPSSAVAPTWPALARTPIEASPRCPSRAPSTARTSRSARSRRQSRRGPPDAAAPPRSGVQPPRAPRGTMTSTHTSRWSELGNGKTPVSRKSGRRSVGQNTAPSTIRRFRLGRT